jgi:thiosulfate/3-mercaptopyruvate sulfurtransferase
MSCTDCHGGIDTLEKEAAHAHSTLQGYWTAIDARSTPEDHTPLEEMFGKHCASCHTTCGDCHVSQPNSVGGGLIEGHVFNKTP